MNPAFLLRYWKYIAGAALLGLAWWALHSYGERRYGDGVASNEAKHVAAAAKAKSEHDANIATINKDHHASELALQARLATALARPATRTIRVPTSACPRAAPVPGDASLPAGADPAGGSFEVHDRGYDSFRVWLLHYAAGPSAGGGTDAALPAGR
jgi:hypothetical protein